MSVFLYDAIPWLREQVHCAFEDPNWVENASSLSSSSQHGRYSQSSERERMQLTWNEIKENVTSTKVEMYRKTLDKYRSLDARFFDTLKTLLAKHQLSPSWSLWLLSRPDTLWDPLFVNKTILVRWSAAAVKEYRGRLLQWLDWVACVLEEVEEDLWFDDFVETVKNPQLTSVWIPDFLPSKEMIYVQVQIEDPLDGDLLQFEFGFWPKTGNVAIDDTGCRKIRMCPSAAATVLDLPPPTSTSTSRRFCQLETMAVSRYWDKMPPTLEETNLQTWQEESTTRSPYDGWQFRFVSKYAKTGYDVFQVLCVLFQQRLIPLDPVLYQNFHAGSIIVIPRELLFCPPSHLAATQHLSPAPAAAPTAAPASFLSLLQPRPHRCETIQVGLDHDNESGIRILPFSWQDGTPSPTATAAVATTDTDTDAEEYDPEMAAITTAEDDNQTMQMLLSEVDSLVGSITGTSTTAIQPGLPNS